MSSKIVSQSVFYGVLGTMAVGSFLLPSELSPPTILANPSGAPTMRIPGVVRDFKKGHADFGVTPSGGNGHYAGNVGATLTSDGRPTFKGVSAGPVTSFAISNGATVPQVSYTPMVTVIGSAVSYGGQYDMPVSVQVHVGAETLQPYGDYTKALASNVNKAGNPRKYIHPTTVAKDTPVWIDGKVWSKKQSSYNGTLETHWQQYAAFSSRPSSNQIKVLKNGDSVPNVDGFKDQASVKTFLKDYINTATKKAVLKSNQTIYLFEFGSTSGAAADWQDLVVLVTLGENVSYLNTVDAVGNAAGGGTGGTVASGFKVATQWKDNQGNPIAPHLFVSGSDTAGSKGANSTGAISSTASFDQWFDDTIGVNLSASHTITLTRNDSGVWEYLTDNFHPIDSLMYGNEGDPHNNFFTYSFSADFTHSAGAGFFFEFSGDDDAWLFVDGNLVMDLGGIIPGTRQYVNFDRLGLSNGQKHTIKFFYAQRQTNFSRFRLRTNLPLEGQYDIASVMTGYD